MSELRIAVNDAMNDLHEWVQVTAKERGKIASGSTMRSLQIATAETSSFVEGTLSADSQWRYWGNGRGPGGIPPVDNLKKWTDAKGLDISPYALAFTIAAKGTRDFRDKRTNIILEAEKAWLQHDVPTLEERSAKHMDDRIVEVARQTLPGEWRMR